MYLILEDIYDINVERIFPHAKEFRYLIRIQLTSVYFLDGASESDISDLVSELNILKEINKIPHPNVIRFIGGCSIAGNVFSIKKQCEFENSVTDLELIKVFQF